MQVSTQYTDYYQATQAYRSGGEVVKATAAATESAQTSAAAYNVEISGSARNQAQSDFNQEQRASETDFNREQAQNSQRFEQEQHRAESQFSQEQQTEKARFQQQQMLQEAQFRREDSSQPATLDTIA